MTTHGTTFVPPDPLPVALRGRQLIDEPRLNKSTAFPLDERDAFGLRGLLPARVSTIDEQVARELANVRDKADNLDRFIGLIALLDRNETVFYRLLVEHLEELLPLVYTPTVGLGCQSYSRIFRQPRGVWITPADRGHIEDILLNAGGRRIRLMVVTDNERILGLGDQGAGGMGISIGKLALYTAGAGIHPSITLPVSLDVGTDNRALLDDPTYIGWRHERVRGPEYQEFLDDFVAAVHQVCPAALVQWEDFKQQNAIRVLDRYRNRIPSFNDDIQGTAAVAVAGILAALRRTGDSMRDQRFLFLGAGAAGIGIARLVRSVMRADGADEPTQRRAIVMIDSRGPVVEGRLDLDEGKRGFCLDRADAEAFGIHEPHSELDDVVRGFRPSVMIGTTSIPGAFTEAAITEMGRHVDTPIVFPLSNPTSQSEATPEDVLRWTGGRAIVATGSPFPPVQLDGGEHVIGQANNAYVFPGIGLGAIVAEATALSDTLFLAAAHELSALVGDDRLSSGALFPPQSRLRDVSRRIAVAVATTAREDGSGLDQPDAEISRKVDAAMWFPDYPAYVPA